MEKKRKIAICGACMGVIAVIAVAVLLIIGVGGNSPEDAINDMAKALNELDFDAYVGTLHPALQSDAKKGMTQENKSSYMHTLRSGMLADYPSGSKIQITHFESYDIDSAGITEIKEQYKELGYNVSIEQAKTYYYYSVMLDSGEPDGLDSVTVVRSGAKWYLLP